MINGRPYRGSNSPCCFSHVWENPLMRIVDHMKNYGASLHDAVPTICIENHM